MYTGQMALPVMQISPVKLKINVSNRYYSKIKVGMPVGVKVDVLKMKHSLQSISYLPY